MDLRTSEAVRIASLSVKKKSITETINKKKEQISSVQEVIGRLEEQVAKINEDITKIQIKAAKQAESEAQKNPVQKEEVDESDAATTTGALGSSSQSSGDSSGWSGSGWKFYDKVGPILRRKRCSNNDSECKNENVNVNESNTYESFINDVWESEGE